MIIYQNNLEKFIQDVSLNKISEILYQNLRSRHLSGGSPSEINAWNNSLHFMKDVLQTPGIPTDCDVAIEYNIPQTSKRVDFMILGKDIYEEDHIVIVELKQWAKVEKIDDISKHSVKADLRGNEPVAHPSYQAYSYKSLIMNYCDMGGLGNSNLNPCSYLHNLREDYRPVIEDSIYSDWVKEAPVFLSNDVLKLRKYIEQYIHAKSASGDLLYKIDFGRIKPTKSLQDALDSMLCGNEEFKMIDEQAVAYDYIMRAILRSQNDQKKHVIIVTGGPGTGKSVLAVNLLADCIRKLALNAAYVTKNSAPRNCYKKLLARGNARQAVNLEMAIRSPHCLPNTEPDGIDVGIFDEAHRMVKKPYMYKGQDMLWDAIQAARVSVFFVDEDQRITTKDQYSVDTILKYAERAGAVIETKKPYELTSQFRCNGSDGYIAFLDNLLNIRKTANTVLDTENFDFRVFSSPQEMKDALFNADNGKNRSRMCAGYCFDWNVKHGRGEWDIIIGDFKARWNLPNDEIFAVNPTSMNEIGCIHTVQGMEFDYVGVIIGKDLIYRNGQVTTDKKAVSKDDGSSGIRKCADEALADRLIRNTYKVLLTRGQKGCFVFCEDEALGEYLKAKCEESKRIAAEEAERHTEKAIEDEKTEEIIEMPPMVKVRYFETLAAAGYSEDQGSVEFINTIENEIELPEDDVPYGTDFAVSISGRSMEPEIEDGDVVFVSWKRRKTIQNGDIGIFNVDGKTVCKRFYTDERGIYLVSENEELEESNVFISYDDENYYCRGIVLGHKRSLPEYFKDSLKDR